MLLENQPNYSHLQRSISIDTLRSLGDRLGDRNVDLRLNLHQNERLAPQNLNNGLELNLSLNGADRLLQDRIQQERNLERLINERNMISEQNRMNLDHSLSLERLNLERSLTQNLDTRNMLHNDRVPNLNVSPNGDRDRTLIDRNLNSERSLNLNNLENRLYNERLPPPLPNADRHPNTILNNPDLNDLKYREYKNHLENLRSSDSSRVEEERGETPTTPPTPLSVGENFNEEKVTHPTIDWLIDLAGGGRPSVKLKSLDLLFDFILFCFFDFFSVCCCCCAVCCGLRVELCQVVRAWRPSRRWPRRLCAAPEIFCSPEPPVGRAEAKI